jgi:alpha-L-fucosidase
MEDTRPHRASDSAPFDEPSLASIRRHPIPEWYDDAKLGIFIHWSLSSVPGYAPRDRNINELLRTRYDDMQVHVPYTEWYENSLRFAGSPVSRFHREHHPERSYESFRDPWLAALERWDPAAWAQRFAAAGARYVVLVAKHHDGFCLWPSRVRNPRRPDWFSPRDCVGELASAVRERGMRFGVYYSGGLDWTFETHPIANLGDLVAAVPGGDYPAYADAQVRELIERYRPDVLWNDIAWPGDRESFVRLVAHYYAQLPEGVINDRWITTSWLFRALRLAPVRALANRLIKWSVSRPDADITPPRSAHYDARTPEYAVFPEIRREKWECVRGMDKSFGYNRASLPEDFLSREALLHSVADIASKNGNLLLNVGPRGEDAAIPEPQLERLAWLGAWLDRDGEAIHATRPWRRAEGDTAQGVPLRFTRRGERVFAILLGRPEGTRITLRNLRLAAGGSVVLLGRGRVRATAEAADLRVDLDAPLPEGPIHALALSGAGGP